MTYAREPFRWGTFIVTASAIGLAAYLWDYHRVNVYFWLADLIRIRPGWLGAALGLLASAGLLLMLVGTGVLLRQKSRWYRRHFRHRTKMGKIADWCFGIPLLYFTWGMLFSLVILIHSITG